MTIVSSAIPGGMPSELGTIRGRVIEPASSGPGGVGQGDLVAPAVVLPFELDDVTATGGGAGEAHRREHRFGPRRAEADHLDPRHQLDQGTGDLRLQRVAGAVHRTAAKLPRDGRDDRRVGVAEDERPVAEQVVDVAVAVDVEQVRPLAAVDEDRMGIDEGAVVGADPTGQDAPSFVEQRPGSD